MQSCSLKDVKAVLLSDGWHNVYDESFDTEYRVDFYHDDEETLVLYFRFKSSIGDAISGRAGSRFRSIRWIQGPVSSIQAIRMEEEIPVSDDDEPPF
jgi:hypothetical protein